MYKKTILSVAIASALTLTGCLDKTSDNPEKASNAGVTTAPQPVDLTGFATTSYPVFSPATSEFPIPNDFLFDKVAGDGTFGVPDSVPPVTTALNALSGASTVAPIDIKIHGAVDDTTLANNVFLIALDYASNSPVQGLSLQEPPTILPASQPSYALEHIELDGDSYIRINPKTPLNPLTRYIVVVTDNVKDTNGSPLARSPGAAGYGALSDADRGIANPALLPAQALINNLWEPVALEFFNAPSSVNAQREAFDLSPFTEESIVLSYSFTTSGDEKVMEYIANPSEWFNDQIDTFVGVTAAKSVLGYVNEDTGEDFSPGLGDLNGDEAIDFTDIQLAKSGGIAKFPMTLSDEAQATLGALAAAFPALGGEDAAECSGVDAGALYITCVSKVLAHPTFTPFKDSDGNSLLPTPKAQTSSTTSANIPVSLVSAPVASLIQDKTKPPLVSQGTINTPYYLGIPGGTEAEDGAVINSQSWTANNALAAAINSAFSSLGLELPQGVDTNSDPDVTEYKSSAINYIFPFPKQSDANTEDPTVDNNTIPWLAIYPHPASTAPARGTVIYQHGITTDRSAALSAGTVLAEQGFTVIAIDQVAHGVAPFSTASQLTLAQSLLTAGQDGGLPPNLAPGEFISEGVTTEQAVVAGALNTGFVSIAATGGNETAAQGLIATVLGGGTSGDVGLDTAIATLASFENTVANSGSFIPGIAPTSNERHFNFTADATGLVPTPMDYNPESALGSSGSLFINLLGFTNSRDKNRQGVLDLLNLRESLENIDLNNDTTAGDLDSTKFYFAGHSLGTVIGIPFVTVANSTPIGNIEASSFLEPASGISRMLENSGSFSAKILGGLAAKGITQGTSNFELYMNTLQAVLDSVDPINFADNLGGSATGSYQTNADVEGTLLIINVGTADGNGTTVFKSDQTNIIEAETTQLGNATKSYFAGIEPFSDALGVSDVIGATPDGTPDKLRSRLGFGNHGMFVLPIVSAAETEALGETEATAEGNRRAAAFQEGLAQVVTFFVANGEMTGITDESGLKGIPNTLINETDYDSRPNKQLN